jgi:ribosome-associated protein
MSEDEKKSRTRLKLEHRALKVLGSRLVELSPGQLQAVPLSHRTREAVEAARSMKRAALQRQLRHLASLMEEEDVDAVRSALAGALRPHAHEVAALHRAEAWREKLLAGDDECMERFVQDHPTGDRQHLRQLIRNACKERDAGKPPRSSRQLFRYLKDLLSEASE